MAKHREIVRADVVKLFYWYAQLEYAANPANQSGSSSEFLGRFTKTLDPVSKRAHTFLATRTSEIQLINTYLLLWLGRDIARSQHPQSPKERLFNSVDEVEGMFAWVTQRGQDVDDDLHETEVFPIDEMRAFIVANLGDAYHWLRLACEAEGIELPKVEPMS